MSYKIIALDLDGTLTNSEKIITEKTKQALMDCQEKGVKVVLASGRPTAGIVKLAKELELDRFGGFVLAFNGARIIDFKTREVIYNEILPANRISEIYESALALDVGIVTYTEDEIILGNGVDEYNELEAKVNGIPAREVDDFSEFFNFPLNKCLFTGEPEKIARGERVLKKRFREYLNIYRSEPYFLEIMPPDVDKAYSLGKLLEYLGLKKEQMICCGDGYNDLSMIKMAGLGVAMENAQEIVKKAARFITFSNDKDGIAYVVEKFLA